MFELSLVYTTFLVKLLKVHLDNLYTITFLKFFTVFQIGIKKDAIKHLFISFFLSVTVLCQCLIILLPFCILFDKLVYINIYV